MSHAFHTTRADAMRILEHYPDLGVVGLKRLGNGLINHTFAVESERGSFVLQRVHPVFSPAIHHNIVAVTRRLLERSMVTPELVADAAGKLWLETEDGVWRLMTRVAGATFDAVQTAEQAFAAAGLLARFHSALVDLPHTFVGIRATVHDTAVHLGYLQEVVQKQRSHRFYSSVAPLAAAIVAGAQRLPDLDHTPKRIVHGDPKFSNVLFAGAAGPAAAQAVCMVDLDTLAPMALHLELGDAWRSWCNRAGEDLNEPHFDLEIFEASLRGYFGSLGFTLAPSERAALLHGVEWITLELAARFAADALAECYFGWDDKAFATAGEHNLVRAAGQWALHRQVLAQRSERERRLESVLGGRVKE